MLASLPLYLFVSRELVRQPFPVQLRRRLELLGPTFVKLGQLLSLRRDLLPETVTSELRNLLDRLPPVPFEAIQEIVERDLGRPLDELFAWVDPAPLASASIAQTHRATTHSGEAVILKVVKPGIRHVLHRDARLLRGVGATLQLLLPRYHPRRLVAEFLQYTLHEVEMTREAENAETFAANFRDLPEVVFPGIERTLSGRDVLCMEYLEGFRPDTPEALALSAEDRARLIDAGASAVIRMLYQDGFFHADLHPANLLVLPGPRLGFIDLGMVGRLDRELRRSLLYYYYCVVIEDFEGAARYLTALADQAPGCDPAGFRREVEEISRRWRRARRLEEYSLAQLLLESVRRGGHYHMYFPVELVMTVKALVTYEALGFLLDSDFNVAEASERHVRRVFRQMFSPLRLSREVMRGAPDILEAVVRVPALVTEGLRLLEQHTRRPPESPFTGLRATLYGGFCLVSGAMLAAVHVPWPVWTGLIALGLLLPLRRGER